MRFILRGREFDLTADTVVALMTDRRPEPVRRHYVEVAGHRYPPKQVLAEATGLPRLDFTTADAYNVLRRLGFKLGQDGPSVTHEKQSRALDAAERMDEARRRTGPIGVSVTELIREGRRR